MTAADGFDFDGFRLAVRRFVRERLQPLEQEVEESDGLPPGWQDVIGESRGLGLYAGNLPREEGGLGLDLLQQSHVWEELGHVSWPLTYAAFVPNPVLLACRADQRARYLDPVVAGTATGSFALTEPQSGSDTSGMTTVAARDDGGWVIDGRKHFITHGDIADFCVVFAVTDREHTRRPAVTAFVVDRDTPGFTAVRRQRMMGWRGTRQAELVFEGCRVGDEQVLGDVGAGLDLAFRVLRNVRVTVGAYCVGFMQRLVELTLEWSRDRTLFGAALAQKQGIQWMIADMVATTAVARAAVHEAARREHDLQGADVAAVKLFTTQALSKVVDMALEIHGGAGWCKDLPIERMYRDARAFRIIDGPDEVQKGIIWRSVA